ncbi:Eco57I restriction-modification methylase domain-containing protein [Fictibacillus nanhaiensis]|uniref:Eco57I restriction-modification methylase domain-containing protein n=1 Tax=Fictibacillus nanhaiensis TaxID=742169 RepID=UPI002E1EFCC7|nr:Eco57I restriction-modification methylase domain-containing protein [Fictibacillus nanhaiensis]MED1863803.1 Eco57I restriction-modification methylase domain-containing protein [Fictibacillus nanhaiensis]
MSEVLDKLSVQLKSSNFEFMKLDNDLASFYKLVTEAELQFALQDYENTIENVRKVTESLTELIIVLNYDTVPYRASFKDKLSIIKKYDIPEKVIDNFCEIKSSRYKEVYSIGENMVLSYTILGQLRVILYWYMDTYNNVEIKRTKFIEPTVIQRFKSSQERKIVYIQSADNSSGKWPAYEGAEKIGETTAPEEDQEEDWSPNSEFLRSVTRKRINSYMRTAGVPARIDWAELAWIKETKSWFGDKDVHEVLTRSGYNQKEELDGTEWFQVDLETAKAAIKAVKEGRNSLKLENKEGPQKIVLRPEQEAAVKQATKAFKKHQNVLWNAKMRFGKTLSTYELIKQNNFKKVLVMTHRPVVSDSWFDDFKKIKMEKAGYEYASKTMGEKDLKRLVTGNSSFVYFISIQDLRGATEVGGKFKKNSEFFEIEWDLIVIDEAHEGTKTERGTKLYERLKKDNTKILELSGTPFNILDEFSEEQVFTWDYIMEQQAKIRFSVEHPNKVNPYETLPEVEMYTFEMITDKKYQNNDKYFDFAEFFKVDDNGKLVHETSIKKWLDQISSDGKTNYPFSTKEYRQSIRHTLWLLPSRAAAKSLKVLLDNHPVFSEYSILNIVNDNDNAIISENDDDMVRIRATITDKPSETKTIILTVRKMTTGVNIPALNAVVFLNNTTSAQNYLQAAFRSQTPFSDNVLGMKKKAYIFDFAPDRALNILAKSVSMSHKAGALNTAEQKDKLRTLLNFLPVLEQSGHEMKPYSIDTMMRQLKKAYAEKAVLSGFDDSSIYNDELWKVTQEDIGLFNELSGKVGKTQQTKRTNKIDININGLTEQEQEKAKRGKRKPQEERSEEEKAAIEAEQKLRKERNKMISILRGISIRIPLMIYGMDLDLDKDITLDDFVKNVDDVSWEEFMPKGITKRDFENFKKFYDSEIFVEAGHRIRQAALSANNLSYQERIEKITSIFSGFKNPDKETVLTPWRVVNLQLGKTLGGYNFFDESYREPLSDARYREIDNGEITEEVFAKDAKILEINSKTGLYPLYMAFSIYQRRHLQESESWAKAEYVKKDKELWQEVLENNIFVLNKTPMARTITYRTLNGYEINKNFAKNLVYIDDLQKKIRKNLVETKSEILTKFGGENVKFDVVVGNPPYQEASDVNNRQEPIYQYFYDLSETMAGIYCLISPARFLFNAGLTSKPWNQKMLNDPHLKVEYYNQNSNEIFPNTDIKGGVVILYRDGNKEFGAINEFIPEKNLRKIASHFTPDLEKNLPSIMFGGRSDLKFNEEFLRDFPNSKNDRLLFIQEKRSEVKELGPNEEYEIKSSTFEALHYAFEEKVPINSEDYYKLLGLINGKRVWRWISKKYTSARYPEKNNIDKWKVFIPKANGSGSFGEILSTPVIGRPFESATPTFISIGAFNTESDAKNVMKYIKTKFLRCLLGILKITQDNPPSKWAYIPLQDFTNNSDIDWSKNISAIDQQLYKKYGLSQSEIDFIEDKVKVMD